MRASSPAPSSPSKALDDFDCCSWTCACAALTEGPLRDSRLPGCVILVRPACSRPMSVLFERACDRSSFEMARGPSFTTSPSRRRLVLVHAAATQCSMPSMSSYLVRDDDIRPSTEGRILEAFAPYERLPLAGDSEYEGRVERIVCVRMFGSWAVRVCVATLFRASLGGYSGLQRSSSWDTSIAVTVSRMVKCILGRRGR